MAKGEVPQSCSWPSTFTDTLWHDSDRGEVTFTDTTMSGWDVTAQGGSVIEDWECYSANETSADTLTLVFKATTTFTIFNIVYFTFACLKMTAFSENAYYYYQMSGEEERLGNSRLLVLEQSTVSTDPPTEDFICISTTSAKAPTINEYHVMIRNDNTESAIRTCPNDYIGNHKYTVTDSTSTYCDGGDTSWDACTSTDTMAFSYSLCSTVLAHSEQGIVNCVFDMNNADNHLLTVMTKEITSTERFTCFSSYLAGNGTLFVSQHPGSCSKSQTPFAIPTSNDGSITGLKMVLTDSTICGSTTTTSTTPSTTTTTTTTTTSTTTSTSTSTTTPSTTTSSTTTTSTTTTSPTTTTTKTSAAPTTTSSTTTTSTTTPAPTTTVDATTQKPSRNDKTAMYVAIVAGCVAAILLFILIAILVKRFCCKDKPPRPKTPNLNIETLPHKTAGYGVIPRTLSNAPRETTIIVERNPEKDVFVFPHAETNDFTMTVPRKPSFVGSDKRRNSFPNIQPINCVNKMSSVNVPIWEASPTPALMPSNTSTTTAAPATKESSYVSSAAKQSEISKTVNVFDGIIMDENVNFALRYSSRMKNVKRDWCERRSSGSLSLMSEKTVSLPVVNYSDKSNTRRVSITDITATPLFENGLTTADMSSSNVFESYTDTGSCTNDMFVSPVSEMSLPVSPVNSDT